MTTTKTIRAQVNQTILELLQGDITQQDTEAIVNAANAKLVIGGGVDRAIHQAAGPELFTETQTLGGILAGDAKITKGYQLKARYIIHAVGPVYSLDPFSAPDLLASTYRRSLEIAAQNQLKSVAFPAISTGIYGYPVEEAAPVALQSVHDFALTNTQIELVRFVLFNEQFLTVFASALDQIIQQHATLRYV